MGCSLSHSSYGSTQIESIYAYIAYLMYHGYKAKYDKHKNMIKISDYGYYSFFFDSKNGIYRLTIKWKCQNFSNDVV